jgi:membrane fusion protein (multidrug efflux system)
MKETDGILKSTCRLTTAMCLVALGACSGEGAGSAPQAAAVPPGAAAATSVTLPVVQAVTGTIERSVTLPAQVQPLRQATLYARVPGYLKDIRVDKGDKVAAGALIAHIEVPELQAARARQQAELQAASSEYQRLHDTQQRAPDLVVPLAVDQALGRRDVAQASLQQSDTMLKYATITAPFAGVVTQRLVDPGALIPAGGTAVVTLMDFSTVRLQIPVPEAEATYVQLGQHVVITTDDLAGTTFDGKVARYAYALDPATRTMLTEVVLVNPALKLRPGMLVNVRLDIQRHERVLLVPVGALVSDKSGTYVWKHVAGKAARQVVKTGFNDGKNVEIVEGLTANDAVVVVGKRSLKAGQAVQPGTAP